NSPAAGEKPWRRRKPCGKLRNRTVSEKNTPRCSSLREQTMVLTLAEPSSNPMAAPIDRFEALFGHFYAELYGLVYRVLGERMATEDILQDTFLKLSDDPGLQARPDAEVGA